MESERPPEATEVAGRSCTTCVQFTDCHQHVLGRALPMQSREEHSLCPEGGEEATEFSILTALDSVSATGVSRLHLLPTLKSAAKS